MRKVLFRADGSADIGLGHVIRSLALAEMLKEHFYCVFAIQGPNEPLFQQIVAVCHEVIVLPKTDERLNFQNELDAYLSGDEVVVLDGYKFDTAYQKSIKDKGCMLACIDDIHAYHFLADLVINHGIKSGSVYSIENYTRLLLGPSYSLLRQPFLQQIREGFCPKKENSLFLCFGGSDSSNLTYKFLERLMKLEGLGAVHVVVGSAFQQDAALQQLLQKNPNASVNLYRNISAQELVDIIKTCKVAIVPGSTIAIECASVGVPILCGYYVANQYDVVQMLGDTGLAITVGDFTQLEESHFVNKVRELLLTDALSWFNNSRLLFDGKARERYIKEFQYLFMLSDIKIREASKMDVDLYYKWANDPIVRQSAINQEPIQYENHCKWFISKLSSPDSHLYVSNVYGKDIGQVRFDLEGQYFYISYSVSNELRGQGFAIPMLKASIRKLCEERNNPFVLKALVKENNTASIKVFRSLQFDSIGNIQIEAMNYLVFEKHFNDRIALNN